MTINEIVQEFFDNNNNEYKVLATSFKPYFIGCVVTKNGRAENIVISRYDLYFNILKFRTENKKLETKELTDIAKVVFG